MQPLDTLTGQQRWLRAERFAGGAVAIAPSDTVDLAKHVDSIYMGGAGDVKVNMIDGTTVTFKAVPVGTILPIRVSRVYATGTSATLMVGLY